MAGRYENVSSVVGADIAFGTAVVDADDVVIVEADFSSQVAAIFELYKGETDNVPDEVEDNGPTDEIDYMASASVKLAASLVAADTASVYEAVPRLVDLNSLFMVGYQDDHKYTQHPGYKRTTANHAKFFFTDVPAGTYEAKVHVILEATAMAEMKMARASVELGAFVLTVSTVQSPQATTCDLVSVDSLQNNTLVADPIDLFGPLGPPGVDWRRTLTALQSSDDAESKTVQKAMDHLSIVTDQLQILQDGGAYGAKIDRIHVAMDALGGLLKEVVDDQGDPAGAAKHHRNLAAKQTGNKKKTALSKKNAKRRH